LTSLTEYQPPESNFGAGNFGTMFGDIDLSAVDHLKISDDMASGVTWATTASGGPISVDIVARGAGNYSLNGTAGNDTIQGGSGQSTVDIQQGGSDTVIFSGGVSGAGVSNGLEIIGFHASGGGADVLDFTALDLIPDSGSNFIHYGIQNNTGVINALGGTANDVNVLGFTNLSISEATSPESIATILDGLTYGHNFHLGDKMIFLVADALGSSANTNMYLWTDTGPGSLPANGDGHVTANELVKIGTLDNFTQTDISHLTANSFEPVVHV